MEREALLQRSALLRLQLRRQVGNLRGRFRLRPPTLPTAARWSLALGLAAAGRAGGMRLLRLAQAAAIATSLAGAFLALRASHVRQRTDGVARRR